MIHNEWSWINNTAST